MPDDEYGEALTRHVFAVFGIEGEPVELRCPVKDCPEPLIGYAPAGCEVDAESQFSREQHHWRVHLVPAMYRQAAANLNAHPELLDAAVPGASAVIREHGLRFVVE